MNPAFSDLSSEHRAQPVPPEPYGFLADIDATFEWKIFDLTERQRIADVHHHSQADDLGRAVEISEGISHPTKLRTTASNLQVSLVDNALTHC
jgi:hypothetical protein